MNPLVFDISHLPNKPLGTTERFSLDCPVNLEGIDSKSHLTAKVEIMKIEDALNVAVSNIELDVFFECERCLKKITHHIDFPLAERQFYFERPQAVEDVNDLYLIDKKSLTLDISEMLRQEIILHFPLNLVCSRSCLGLCPVCGTDRNKKKCDCKPESDDIDKPLAILKNLIK